MAGAVRGSRSGDVIVSHFTRVLPSISPWININHSSIPAQKQPSRLQTAADKYWCEEKQPKGFTDVCQRPHLGFSFFPFFCPVVQTAVQDLIVPNHCWRSRLFSAIHLCSPALSFSSPLFSLFNRQRYLQGRRRRERPSIRDLQEK